MKTGLSYIETLDLPFGHLRTILNIDMIANGATRKKTQTEEELDFWDALSRE